MKTAYGVGRIFTSEPQRECCCMTSAPQAALLPAASCRCRRLARLLALPLLALCILGCRVLRRLEFPRLLLPPARTQARARNSRRVSCPPSPTRACVADTSTDLGRMSLLTSMPFLQALPGPPARLFLPALVSAAPKPGRSSSRAKSGTMASWVVTATPGGAHTRSAAMPLTPTPTQPRPARWVGGGSAGLRGGHASILMRPAEQCTHGACRDARLQSQAPGPEPHLRSPRQRCCPSSCRPPP